MQKTFRSYSPLLFIGLVLLLTNCKVTQTTSHTGESKDTLLAAIDTFQKPAPITYLITQKGDTLDSLFDEVDIAISRLLPDTVSIIGVGDIMMGSKYPDPSYLPTGNGEYLWDDVRSLLQSADITFGNLEGTVLDGEGEPKECRDPSVCYLFKMPTRLASNLVESGFDLMSMANNHANDFGKAGRISTLHMLDSLHIHGAGSTEQPYTIAKIGHLKIGLVAFAPNRGTLSLYDEDYAEAIVRKLDTLADIVMVSIHGGAEGAKNMHVTRKKEIFYGEDRGNIYAFSHRMIDAGADVVFGHGPHVVRAVEVYKDRFIAYSLGNFLTYGRFNLNGPNGEAPIVEIKTTASGQFLEGNIFSFYQSKTYGPRKDSSNRVMHSMQRLSQEDFPENPIIIDEQGRIIYIQH